MSPNVKSISLSGVTEHNMEVTLHMDIIQDGKKLKDVAKLTVEVNVVEPADNDSENLDESDTPDIQPTADELAGTKKVEVMSMGSALTYNYHKQYALTVEDVCEQDMVVDNSFTTTAYTATDEGASGNEITLPNNVNYNNIQQILSNHGYFAGSSDNDDFNGQQTIIVYVEPDEIDNEQPSSNQHQIVADSNVETADENLDAASGKIDDRSHPVANSTVKPVDDKIDHASEKTDKSCDDVRNADGKVCRSESPLLPDALSDRIQQHNDLKQDVDTQSAKPPVKRCRGRPPKILAQGNNKDVKIVEETIVDNVKLERTSSEYAEVDKQLSKPPARKRPGRPSKSSKKLAQDHMKDVKGLEKAILGHVKQECTSSESAEVDKQLSQPPVKKRRGRPSILPKKLAQFEVKDVKRQTDVTTSFSHKSETVAASPDNKKPPRTCYICDRSFRTHLELKIHKKAHAGERPNCADCGQRFKSYRSLRLHMKSARVRTKKCIFCGEWLKGCGMMEKHLIEQHSGSATIAVKEEGEPDDGDDNLQEVPEDPLTRTSCPVCNKDFPTRRSLGVHCRIHYEIKLMCPVCNKQFFTDAQLEKHMLVHTTGKKVFHCEICNRNFSSRQSLHLHTRSSHAGEKPFQCDLCGNRFTQAVAMRNHIASTHFNQKPYQCDICGKRFTQSDSKVSHMRAHTGVKNFACEICGKLFLYRGSLCHHRRWHLKKMKEELAKENMQNDETGFVETSIAEASIVEAGTVETSM